MKSKTALSKKEIIINLVSIIFVIMNIGAINSNGRERAKRMVCLSNLNKLTLAWLLYADENDGKLVNGAAGTNMPNYHRNELPWVGTDWSVSYSMGGLLPQDQQEQAVRTGALWPYCKNIKLYHCPSGRPGGLRNYSIVDSMNGYPRLGTFSINRGVIVGETVLWIKHISEIHTPGPEKRAVFIDEGWITPDSYAVHYQTQAWWDDPPVRHSNGATLSFADGHSEHWMWKSPNTVSYGLGRDISYSGSPYNPITNQDREDLYRIQKAVWGRLY